MMEHKNDILQEIRKRTIPDLISKYQKLIDNIFDATAKNLPLFTDIIDEETNEVRRTAEQQLYAFIDVRNEALNTANSILNRINDLERELHDPNFEKSNDEAEVISTSAKPGAIRKYSKK